MSKCASEPAISKTLTPAARPLKRAREDDDELTPAGIIEPDVRANEDASAKEDMTAQLSPAMTLTQGTIEKIYNSSSDGNGAIVQVLDVKPFNGNNTGAQRYRCYAAIPIWHAHGGVLIPAVAPESLSRTVCITSR